MTDPQRAALRVRLEHNKEITYENVIRLLRIGQVLTPKGLSAERFAAMVVQSAKEDKS